MSPGGSHRGRVFSAITPDIPSQANTYQDLMANVLPCSDQVDRIDDSIQAFSEGENRVVLYVQK